MSNYGTTAKAVEGYFIDFLQTVIANLPRNITKEESQYLAKNGRLIFIFFANILKKIREDNVINIIVQEGIVVDNFNILKDRRIFEETNKSKGNYQINFDLNNNRATGERIINTLLDSKYCQPTNLYELLSSVFSSFDTNILLSIPSFVSTGAIEINGTKYFPFLYQKSDKSWHLDARHTGYQWPKGTYFIYLRSR